MEGAAAVPKIFGLEYNPEIVLMSWIVIGIVLLIAWLASRKVSWIPKGWQSMMEMAIEFVQGPIRDSVGQRGLKYTYFFCSLFIYILIANMLGLIPGLASPTSDASVTLSLAALAIIWIQYISIRENGFFTHIKHFFQPNPLFFPLHMLELVTRPLTLALRLFGNIYAGEILIKVLTENFSYVVPSIWLLVSVAIGGIQAYIFTLLAVAYTGLTLGSEHH